MSVQKLLLCPFHCKPTQSGVSWESPRLENIPQVPGNRAEVSQNHDARKPISATLSVFKWTGAIFRPRSSKVSAQKVLLCPFFCKPRQSGVSLESPGLENISQLPRNRAEVRQNHHARKAVSATLSVSKWSGAIFRPRSSKPSVQSFYLCPFLCKPRPSGITLEYLGLENIARVSGKQVKVCKNHHARKAFLATLLVLKWSRAIFRPRSSKVSVQKVLLCLFHCKRRASGVSLESPGLENIPQFPGNRAKVA